MGTGPQFRPQIVLQTLQHPILEYVKKYVVNQSLNAHLNRVEVTVLFYVFHITLWNWLIEHLPIALSSKIGLHEMWSSSARQACVADFAPE